MAAPPTNLVDNTQMSQAQCSEQIVCLSTFGVNSAMSHGNGFHNFTWRRVCCGVTTRGVRCIIYNGRRGGRVSNNAHTAPRLPRTLPMLIVVSPPSPTCLASWIVASRSSRRTIPSNWPDYRPYNQHPARSVDQNTCMRAIIHTHVALVITQTQKQPTSSSGSNSLFTTGKAL